MSKYNNSGNGQILAHTQAKDHAYLGKGFAYNDTSSVPLKLLYRFTKIIPYYSLNQKIFTFDSFGAE
ncbi:MAG: hypothetical protein WA865_08645 [Spirulinaceae cyanobacterium]